MGTFYVTIQVADRFRERYANIDALVDTDSSYSSLPESLLDELGIASAMRLDSLSWLTTELSNTTWAKPGCA